MTPRRELPRWVASANEAFVTVEADRELKKRWEVVESRNFRIARYLPIGEQTIQGRASWKSVTGGTCNWKEKSMAATAAAAAAAGIRRGNSVQRATAPLSQFEFRVLSHLDKPHWTQT